MSVEVLETRSNLNYVFYCFFSFLACNCDPRGTLSGTVCTNDITGQCPCKPGVTRRTCDQCLRQYVNFTNAGCERKLS